MGRLLILLAAVLLAAACGGGSDQAADTAAPEDGPDGTPTSEEAERLKSLASRFEGQDVRVRYTFTTTQGGETTEGTFDFWWRTSEGQWRMDVEQPGGTAVIIDDGESAYLCESSSESCFALPSESDAPVPAPFFGQAVQDPDAFDEFILSQAVGGDIETSEREIAGQTASCFAVTTDDGQVEWCFSDDGLMLAYTVESGDGSQTFEATEVSSDLSDADFQPPYEVQQIPQNGGYRPPE